jgi:hypothetical protein
MTRRLVCCLVAAAWAGCVSAQSGPRPTGSGPADAGTTPPDGGTTPPPGTSCTGCPSGQCAADGSCLAAGQCPGGCSAGTFCSTTGTCIPFGSCRANGDCDASAGLVCNLAQGTCVPGSECGQKEFQLSSRPVNMMIVIDRSGTMGDGVPGSGGQSRWQVAAAAIAQLTTTFASQIRFGLVRFSACILFDNCEPGPIEVPIGAGAAAIGNLIATTWLCNTGSSETVIGGTLQALVGEPSLQQADATNTVLLITDGQDNCGGGGAAAATALRNQAVPVQVYVVGFSGDVNAGELQSIAEAAGTAPYRQADDAAQLNAALQAIGQAALSCAYVLDDVPPGTGLHVFFNGNPAGVDNDATNGWTYDAATNTITLHGAACDQVRGGSVSHIDVIYACGEPVLT